MQEKIDTIGITNYMKNLKDSMKYSKELLDVVQDDLEYGLSKDQVRLYLKNNYNSTQIKVISKALREEAQDEFINMLLENELSGNKMQVALDFYLKGIEVIHIKEAIEREETPKQMQSAFKKILDSMAAVKAETPNEAYANALIKKMDDIVKKIDFQETRYDELNKKLDIFEQGKEEQNEKVNLQEQVKIKDNLIREQQDKYDEANKLIDSLQQQLEERDKENKVMSENVIGQNKEPVVNQSSKASNMQMDRAIPIYYQMPMKDANGAIIQPMGVEHTRKKTSGIIGVIEKLCFKKKSRADIVRLVASGSLSPEQLEQIKIALLKGIEEQHLEILINSNVTAERMKVIIEIAELEMAMN